MKHPCNICLVHSACSKDCDDYKLFRRQVRDWVPMVAILLSGIINIVMFLLVIGLAKEIITDIIRILYGLSILFVVYKKQHVDLDIPLLMTIFLGPFMAIFLLLIEGVEKYTRK